MKNQNPEIFGLIGKNIDYSFSPSFFKKKFRNLGRNAIYNNFDLSNLSEVNYRVFSIPNLKGCNVTIPYKNEIIPYLDELSPLAQKLSAVNTIAFHHGKKIGFNTDIIGFRDSLRPLLKKHHKKALILGNGGASSAVVEACHQLKIQTKIVSRKSSKSLLGYSDLNEQILEDFLIIINTTPLGSAHHPNTAPAIPYHLIGANHLCYDLIYNPEITLFLEKSKKQGASIKNGLEMLKIQAEESFQIWENYAQLK